MRLTFELTEGSGDFSILVKSFSAVKRLRVVVWGDSLRPVAGRFGTLESSRMWIKCLREWTASVASSSAKISVR